MIGDGIFQSQLEEIQTILTLFGLFEERQARPDKSQGAASFRGLSYNLVYEKCIRDYIYDFRLVDQSLLLFTKSGADENSGRLSYSYYDSPKMVLSYSDYVALQNGLNTADEDFERSMEEWADSLRNDYDKYVESEALRQTVTPIRYDYIAKDYRPNVHPASHLHVGFNSNIRMGKRRILNPLGFMLLVIRQCYPHVWSKMRGHQKFTSWCGNIRDKLDPVSKKYWGTADENENYLE